MAIGRQQRIPQSGEYMTVEEYFQLDTIAPMLKSAFPFDERTLFDGLYTSLKNWQYCRVHVRSFLKNQP